jgi:exodeoxyribonuclease V beta subunit
MQASLQPVELANHPLDGFSLIEASAGTGKTYTISHLYLRYLLERDLKVQEILVVTFTNAATDELKHRIRQLITGVLHALEAPTDSQSKMEDHFATWRGDDQAIRRLQQALTDFDEVAVFSINGFCQRMLTRFPLETRSMLWQELSAEQSTLETRAAQDFWRKRVLPLARHELLWLNAQWNTPDALLKSARPLIRYQSQLTVALNQLELELQDVNLEYSWQQLCEQWSNRSQQIQQVMFDNPNLKKNGPKAAAIEQLELDLDACFALPVCLELPRDWRVLTRDYLVNSRLKARHEDERLDWPFFRMAQNYAQQLERINRQSRRRWLVEAAIFIHDTVELAKVQAQQISFDDQIEHLERALSQSGEQLARKIRHDYPVAMVDEFQDTDYQQYNLFRQVYLEPAQGSLILIGDPKQSIYGFRRADVFTYRRARDATQQQFTLDTNYRSTDDFVALINGVFGVNPDAFIHSDLIRYQRARPNEDQPGLRTTDGSLAEPLVCWLLQTADRPYSKKVAESELARVCADSIVDLLHDPKLLIDDRPVAAQDLAILVKTGWQASLMQQTLAQRGIASAMVSQDSVFASAEAMDVLQWLSVLHRPGDTRLLHGLLLGNLFAWSRQRVEALQHDDGELLQLLEAFTGYRRCWLSRGILAALFEMFDDWATVGRVLRVSQGERRLTNWLHVVELLQQESMLHANEEQTLLWLHAQIEQAHDGETGSENHQLRLEDDSQLVRIVTVHGSKGLQYPVVFLPFMWSVSSKNLSPTSYAYHDEQGRRQVMIEDDARIGTWREEKLAEEIRLFYVALTRARYRCYLGWGRINECGLAAPAHLLYTERVDRSKFPHQLDLDNHQQLRQPFEALNAQRALVKIIDVEVGVDCTASQREQTRPPVIQPPAQQFDRLLQQQWLVTSYSRLASSSEQAPSTDLPDHDTAPLSGALVDLTDQLLPANNPIRFTFKKGARAGNFIHDVLEITDFTRGVQAESLRAKVDQHGISSNQLDELLEWFDQVLGTPLGDFSLASLPMASTLRELEFLMRIDGADSHRVEQLLKPHGYLDRNQALTFGQINGYLKGFIDLVFEYGGRFYLADYKSNFLGSGFASYTRPSMQLAMQQHLYTLQFLIYSVALHRYLGQRLDGYDYNRHFGGVYYLFVRGMAPQQPGNGVYFERPAKALIAQLDEVFG